MNNFLNFDKYTNELQKRVKDAISEKYEFEIRFGEFKIKRDESGNVERDDRGRVKRFFDSTFETEAFYVLKKMLNKQPSIKKTVKNTNEIIYKMNDGFNARKIIDLSDLSDNSETFLKKKLVNNYDVYDYNMRFSSSNEIEITKDEYESNKTEKTIETEIKREKNRTSYEFSSGKIDLTITKQSFKETIKISYEVEFEISKDDISDIMGIIVFILQNKQSSYYIISDYEKRSVLDTYKKMTGKHYFVGAQPETLAKDKIVNLYKNLYSVTDKADGERYIMLIDNNGMVFFIDNNLKRVIKTDIRSDYRMTIIDCELVKDNNVFHFLAFDLLVFNNEDIRGKKEYFLKQRLDRLNDIMTKTFSTNFYKVYMKRYYFRNVFMASKIILDNVHQNFYENDGLIFTPMDEPYPLTKKWQTLLKWKPDNLNTIDLYAVKIGSGLEENTSRWELYVQHKEKDETNQKENRIKNKKVLFDVSSLCGYKENILMTYITEFSDNLIDQTTDEPFQSNTVLECRWDKKFNKFIPLRTRWDKTVNPEKHGNFSTVACDIWNNINNPVEKELLFKFNVNSVTGDFFFERMRRFHNKIKEYLYNKYCKKIPHLLELCSGKGGDLYKWFYNGVKYVDGYDISEKSIDECKKRYNSLMLKDKTLNYNFFCLDLTKNDSYEHIYKNNNKGFDTVCCQFGIHYFFKSEETLKNIKKILDNSLNDDGYFIVSFLDNTEIDNLFLQSKNQNMCYKEQDNEICYIIQREKTILEVPFGNSLKITLNGNNVLGDGSDEWVIDFQYFKEFMESNGFTCVESELFKNFFTDEKYEFFDCERDISFLNRFCVFKKTPKSDNEKNTESKENVEKENVERDNEIYFPKTIIKDLKNTEFNFQTIDLYQKDISIFKVSSLYDIVDILNCIEYKYYKNQIKNQTLLSDFSTIENGFTDLSILYKPMYISDPLDFKQYKLEKDIIYFTYHKHTIEKHITQIDEGNGDDKEIIEYDNWYIIMYKDALLFNLSQMNSQIHLNNESKNDDDDNVDVTKKNVVDNVVDDNDVTKKNDDDIIKENDKNVVDDNVKETKQQNEKDKVRNDLYDMKNENKKITLKVLKDFLQRLSLKTCGKKEELENRLEMHLKNTVF